MYDGIKKVENARRFCQEDVRPRHVTGSVGNGVIVEQARSARILV
jgi:hypothetical protein